MKTPLVSVIIPAYNRQHLLVDAVSSVVEQDFHDFELIIVDDESTENIVRAVSAVPGIDRINMHWVRLDEHSGMPGKLRNMGVSISSTDYIAFLDSDDIWTRDKLTKQYQLMKILKKKNIRICHTREKWLRDGKVISQKSQKHQRKGDIFADALWKCIIGPSTVMLEKSLFEEVGGFREDLEVAEDYELWLKITALEEVGYLDEMLTTKRAGQWNQLSQKHGQIEIFRIEALKSLLDQDYFPDGKHRILAAEILREKCRIYAQGCRKRERYDEAEYYEGFVVGDFGYCE